MEQEFFPPRPASHPMIYAYSVPQHPGCLKVGFTAVDVDRRVAQQFPILPPDGRRPYKIEWREPAMRSDGSSFDDHAVHRVLARMDGVEAKEGEWFRCSVADVQAAILAVRLRTDNPEKRTLSFAMRPEQAAAVARTEEYYRSARADMPDRPPKFLWNAKMRFGKTFAAYQLAKKMGFARVLVLTFKPAVEKAWHDDLLNHSDFEGWQFICRPKSSNEAGMDAQYQKADKTRPIVCFGSFQDFLGINPETGGIKANNEWVHLNHWDLVVFDEYHFGAWRENAKALFESDEDQYDEDLSLYQRGDAVDESCLPISTSYYLYLSGTPFRALNSGEFIEEQIYNWTYSDEQNAKQQWVGADNPYAGLPRMVMMTYRLPEAIENIARRGEFNEFDLNVFFSAEGRDAGARFVYEDSVQKWLNLIRGSYLEESEKDLKLGMEKAPMPFADTRLLSVLGHSFWFLPGVAACDAMENLLKQRQNLFYHDYQVINCAGNKAGMGVLALDPVERAMGDPLSSKTITLSCGKLTTGVTVAPWTGIFMLRNLNSPETYFQAAFRVQSPWEILNDDGRKEIIKKECYLFDFAPDRALKQVVDYSCRLNVAESNPEKKLGEFIRFLPVLAYDGSAMRRVDAGELLDLTLSGTSATLLARRWESALLVNVDNETLARLLGNTEAMRVLMNIEGFRSLNEDIETIINKSEAVKKARREEEKLSPEQKKELSEDEKDFKSKRKLIQEKLIKFATRIPIFMYLSDYREYSLKDVITIWEPDLFKSVTGLEVADFELLVSLNVFNEALMDDAVFKFKRYEDASLGYAGVNRHKDENVGLFDVVLTRAEYEEMARASRLADLAELREEELPEELVTEAEEDEDLEDFSALAEEDSLPPARAFRSTRSTQKGAKSKRKPIVEEWDPPMPSTPPDTPQSIQVSVSALVEDVEAVDMPKPGSQLRHKSFGLGQVLRVEDGRIWLRFAVGDKKFAYPDALQAGYLQKDDVR